MKTRGDFTQTTEAKARSKPASIEIESDFSKGSIAELDTFLFAQKETKANHLNACTGQGTCSCGDATKIDLIVLIDTSGSMRNAALQVSAAAEAGIEMANKAWKTDLRITFMGVEGVTPGTKFTVNHLEYLKNLQPSAVFASQTGHVGYRREQGANAIEDLSDFYDWRSGARRAIFFISDQELDGSRPNNDFENETKVTDSAVLAANQNQVTVFANHLTYKGLHANILQNYQDLCSKTGGECFFSLVLSRDEYAHLLAKIICEVRDEKDASIGIPKLQPCISVSWGSADSIEISDFELMYITMSNCYSDVSFRNLSIGHVHVTDAAGEAVPMLPDGAAAVQALPIGPFSFGDIGPCTDGRPTSVSRQFVLVNRGAKSGKYNLTVGAISYDITFHYEEKACFELAL